VNKEWWMNPPEELFRHDTEPPGDQAAKQDDGKARWDLLLTPLPHALDAVLEVLQRGEERYGSGNTWRTVDPLRYKRAAIRHLIASLRGETVNEADWGVQHLAQAIVDALFALENESGECHE
jgi:hypothetical protein